MYGSQSRCKLHKIAPENLFGNDVAWGPSSRMISAIRGEMLLYKRFGQRVIVGHEDKGAITEGACSEAVMDSNDVCIADAFPRL